MEEELCNWKNSVKKARRTFYELNYYTTLQLLILREQLCKKDGMRIESISTVIFALLQNISLNITLPMIIKAVNKNPPNATESGPAERRTKYEQDMVLAVQESYMFHENLILRAIQSCPDSSNVEDIAQWCLLHETEASNEEDISSKTNNMLYNIEFLIII